jgi:5-methylcytosine-specific restriction endonuclease McrA
VKPVSDKRRKRDAVYPQRRREVFARGDGTCEFCLSVPMTEVHHVRGRGGPDPHRLENLMGLCRDCHTSAHQWPEWAREHGLMRSRHV